MRLPRFEYVEPKTIKEACSLLTQPETKLIAGGTELLVNMKQKTMTPKALVNIKRIPRLNYIEYQADEGLSIGPATTLYAVATSSIVRDRFGILAQAASSVGKPQIPNMATIGGNICLDSRCFYFNQSHLWKQSRPACHKDGGNLCHMVKGSDHCYALFVADTVPALIALGAKVTVADAANEKQIPLDKFYTGRGEKVNILQPGQVVTRIQIPAPLPHSGGVYLKFSLREAIDFAIVGIGIVITLKPGDWVCRDAKIVLGSVATGPVRAVETEATIRGRAIDDKLVATAAQMTLKEVHPITHMGISADYKRKIIETLTKRAIIQAWEQAKSG